MLVPDIYRTAYLLIEEHGAGATALALSRVYEMADTGDGAGFSDWLRILNAAEELQSTQRRSCDPLH